MISLISTPVGGFVAVDPSGRYVGFVWGSGINWFCQYLNEDPQPRTVDRKSAVAYLTGRSGLVSA